MLSGALSGPPDLNCSLKACGRRVVLHACELHGGGLSCMRVRLWTPEISFHPCSSKHGMRKQQPYQACLRGSSERRTSMSNLKTTEYRQIW